jgi:hypothetical protein
MVLWTAMLVATAASGAACAGTTQPADSTLGRLYAGGKTYAAFRDAARHRVSAWKNHYARAEVPDALVARVTALPGRWRLLVVAEDRCGDSANTIPYVARLVDLAPNLDLRIIDSKSGRRIMESHRTPDGRPATPTVVLLNEEFEESGCWIERPSKLQTWFLEHEKTMEESVLYEQKYAWYAQDAGRETLEEVVTMIEVAAAGGRRCAAGPRS